MKIPNLKNIKIGKKEMLVILVVLIIAVVSVLVVRNSESANKGKRHSASFKAIETYVNVTCYGSKGDAACKEVKKELTHMEDKEKGKAFDKAKEVILEAGVKSALVTMGEDVLCIGSKPDGKLWRVGVKNLGSSDSEMIGVLEIQNLTVVTVGDKENQSSVTVLAENGTLAEKMATVLISLSPEEAANSWRKSNEENQDAFDFIFIKEDKIYASKGLKNSFSSEEKIGWIE